MNRLMKTVSFTALTLALALGPHAASANTEVGAMAAVNRDIDGTPPGQGTRALLLGDRVITNEKLVSSNVGSGQILFLDQTSLTVSPNSEIVLDEYVYDPDADSGAIGLTVTRGVMRLVGGRITKSNDGVVRTPTATIGIRGGIGLVSIEDDGSATVMHIAGEYTKIEAGGETLTMSRSNAYANVPSGGGVPEYLGTASEEQIARLYNRMQGGGGGTANAPEDEDAEASGISELNSEDPDTVTDEPISTSGESNADDQSAELEQADLQSDTQVQQDQQTSSDQVQVDPFANFIGGLLTAGPDPFTDPFGDTIDNPRQQNFLFAEEGLLATSFADGSLIATLEDGTVVTLPTPGAGVFTIDPALTSSPEGPLSGRGFADSDSGLIAYYLRAEQTGEIGALLAAEKGPTQLRNLNSTTNAFRATSFNILPDLQISSTLTAQPFLPEGVGEQLDNGEQSRMFLITLPNTATFGPGTGSSSATGTKVLIPQFSLIGTGVNQRYILQVGATGILNNGTDAPDISSFARGSYRIGGNGVAIRLGSVAGTTAVPETVSQDFGGSTVFGRFDNYFLLGNSSAFQDGDDPIEEASVSFTQDIVNGTFDTYGNLHLAQRSGDQILDPTQRINRGATPAAFAAERGFTDATQFAPNQARFFSFGYAANSAVFRDGFGGADKFLFGTAADIDGGTAAFRRDNATGGAVIFLDRTQDESSGLIDSAQFIFGGGRSAVIDNDSYGMRDASDPADFANILVDPSTPFNFVNTTTGLKQGRAPDQFGQRAFRGALLGSGLANANAIFPANTQLQPQYLTWGWWTGQFRFGPGTPPSDPFSNARLQFALGTYVYGDRTDVLPLTGTATYTGPVIVNALTASGADFVDGGRFQLTWDFGIGSGAAGFQDVLNFGTFSVPVSLTGATGVNDYGGSTLIGGTMATAGVNGSFFDGPLANDARATAGSIFIDDPVNSFSANGTFWGER